MTSCPWKFQPSNITNHTVTIRWTPAYSNPYITQLLAVPQAPVLVLAVRCFMCTATSVAVRTIDNRSSRRTLIKRTRREIFRRSCWLTSWLLKRGPARKEPRGVLHLFCILTSSSTIRGDFEERQPFCKGQCCMYYPLLCTWKRKTTSERFS